MRYVSLVLVWLSAGCHIVFPLGERADANTADDVSPTDSVVDGDGDGDGDGVADGIDNCPAIANPKQDDEDADRRGDACDKCPHMSSASGNDNDNDGVGDECDPRPMIAGDRLEFFVGFNDVSLAPRWNQVAGAWNATGGELQIAATGFSRLALSGMLSGSMRIEAELAVASSSTGAGGVLFDYNNTGLLCGFFDTGADTRGLFDLTSNMITVLGTISSGTPGTVYRYQASTSADSRSCSSTGSTGVNGFASPHNARVGLFATDVVMSVRWFVVIVSP